jgi:CBS domain-containing protein
MALIKDVMTPDPKLITPADNLQQAAQQMRENNCGILPVQDGDRLVGMITDRDIVIRCIADGKGPDTQVRAAMTEEVKYCFEEDEVEDVCQNLGENQLRRLPVLNQEKRLVGIVSLSDLSSVEPDIAGEALNQITQTGGLHSS